MVQIPRLAAICALLLLAMTAAGQAPVFTYRVVHTYPHDRSAFTQGLLYFDGFLYEGTGIEGHSVVRKVRLETGEVLQEVPIDPSLFGEGIVILGPHLVELTWRSGLGFVYDRATLRRLRSFRYSGEGWGITTDGKSLIMSDGSAVLRYWDPQNFSEIRRLEVRDQGRPVENLNELEYVEGEILANVWQTDTIVRISPTDGRVTGRIDLRGLLTPEERDSGPDVLNGIAYDAQKKRLFVTGKWWPKLFEIEIVRKSR